MAGSYGATTVSIAFGNARYVDQCTFDLFFR